MDHNDWTGDWQIQGTQAKHKATGCVVRVKEREELDPQMPGGKAIVYSLDFDGLSRTRTELVDQAVVLWKTGKLGPN